MNLAPENNLITNPQIPGRDFHSHQSSRMTRIGRNYGQLCKETKGEKFLLRFNHICVIEVPRRSIIASMSQNTKKRSQCEWCGSSVTSADLCGASVGRCRAGRRNGSSPTPRSARAARHGVRTRGALSGQDHRVCNGRRSV